MPEDNTIKRYATAVAGLALIALAFIAGQKSIRLKPDANHLPDYTPDSKRFSGIWEDEKPIIFKKRPDVAVVGVCTKEDGICSLAETWISKGSVESAPRAYKIQSWTNNTIVAVYTGECFTNTITYNFEIGLVSRVDHQTTAGFVSSCGDVFIRDTKTRLVDADANRLFDVFQNRTPTPEPEALPLPIYATPRWAAAPSAKDVSQFYPSRAREDEVEGSATVECAAMKAGSVACSMVSENPPGYGFGEATVKLYQTKAKLISAAYHTGDRVRFTQRWQLE